MKQNRCLKKIFLSMTIAFAATAVAQVEESVVINRVRWATRNVGAPGTFVQNPEDRGEYYQWNRGTPGIIADYYNSLTVNDYTIDHWEPANDPSPTGYQVASRTAIEYLLDTTYVKQEWAHQNGTGGVRFTDKWNGNSIFLPCNYIRTVLGDSPAAGGAYWSRTVWGYTYKDEWYANTLLFDERYSLHLPPGIVAICTIGERQDANTIRSTTLPGDIYRYDTVNFSATEGGALKAYSYVGEQTSLNRNSKINDLTGKLNTAGMTALITGDGVSDVSTIFFVAEPYYGYRVKEFIINGEPFANLTGATYAYVGSTVPAPANIIATSNITKFQNNYAGIVYDIENKKAGYTGEIIAIKLRGSGDLTVKAVFEKELAAYSVITAVGTEAANGASTWPIVPTTLADVRPRGATNGNGEIGGSGFNETAYGVLTGPSMVLVGNTNDYLQFNFRDEKGNTVQQKIQEIRLYNRGLSQPQITKADVLFGIGTATLVTKTISSFDGIMGILTLETPVDAEWVKIVTSKAVTGTNGTDARYAGYQRIQIIASPSSTTVNYSATEGGELNAYSYVGESTRLNLNSKINDLTGKLNTAEMTSLTSGNEVSDISTVFFVAEPDYGYRIKEFIINGEPFANRTGATYAYVGNTIPAPINIIETSNITKFQNYHAGIVYDIVNKKADYTGEIIAIQLFGSGDLNVKAVFEKELAAYSVITGKGSEGEKDGGGTWPFIPETPADVRPRGAINGNGEIGGLGFNDTAYGVITGPNMVYVGRTAQTAPGGQPDYLRFDFKDEEGKPVTHQINEIRLINRGSVQPQITEAKVEFGIDATTFETKTVTDFTAGTMKILKLEESINANWVKIVTAEAVTGTNGSNAQYAGYQRVQIIASTLSITSIPSFNTKSLQLYPNPATDHITISGLKGNETLRFYDISGALLFSKDAIRETEKISIAHLPAGVYLVKIGSSVIKVTKK